MHTMFDATYESARMAAWERHDAVKAGAALARQVSPGDTPHQLDVPLNVLSADEQARLRQFDHDSRLLKAESERRQQDSWKRIDLLIVHLVCEPGAFRKTIMKGYSFVLAHALGFVSDRTRRKRRSICKPCSFRGRATLPVLGEVDFCNGENGGKGCGCAQHPLWPFSTLGYKTSLANYRCPIGKFPRRWFDGWSWRAPWWSWFGYGLAAWSAAVFLGWMAG